MNYKGLSKAQRRYDAHHVFSAAIKIASWCMVLLALLMKNGWSQPTVSSLITIFTNPHNNVQIRLRAINALDNALPDNAQAIPALISVLGNNLDNVAVRRKALDKLMALVVLNPDLTDEAQTQMLETVKQLRLLQDHDAVRVLVRVSSATDGGDHSKLNLRVAAVQAIGSIGEAVGVVDKGSDDPLQSIRVALRQEAVTSFIDILKNNNEDQRLRIEVVDALQKIGSEAKYSIQSLIDVLDSSGVAFDIRQPIFQALVNINLKLRVTDSKLPAVVEAFKNVLGNKADESSRREAAATLGLIGPAAKNGVPIKLAIGTLTRVLEDSTENKKEVIVAAIESIGQLDRDAKKTKDDLYNDAKSYHMVVEDYDERIKAIPELAREGSQAGPALIEISKRKPVNKEIRKAAIAVLGKLDLRAGDAREAIGILIDVVKDQAGRSPEDQAERSQAIKTAVSIAKGVARNKERNSTAVLKEAKHAIDSLNDPEASRAATEIQDAIDALNEGIWGFIYQWKSWLSIPVGLGLSALVSLALFWLRPLWLWHINESLKDAKLPQAVQILNPVVALVSTTLAFVLIVGLFHYRRRVLDAWVAKHIKRALMRFSAKETVRNRDFHVPVPVVLDGEPIEGELGPQHLRPLFRDNRVCLLICGDGGAGKTSLACQLGKWAMSRDKPLCEDHLMLPVLIEKNLRPAANNGEDVFFDAIRAELQRLIDAAYPLSEKFLDHLLRRKRVLVIVDGLSELDETTREQIVPLSASFAANALIVTSRSDREFEVVNKTTIRPLWIEGGKLSSFLQGYLDKQGEKGKFGDKEFFAACEGLTEMVGTGKVTPLIGKFYADLMIAFKQKEKHGTLPKTVPDLMLDYVEQQNLKVKDGAISSDLIRLFAKVIAWECLAKTYKPTATYLKGIRRAIVIEWESIKPDRPAVAREWLAMKNNVLVSLDKNDVTDEMAADFIADEVIKYFINRLGLLRKDDAERIKFSHDPLAEYLAGLYLAEHYGDDEGRWREFIAGAESVSGGAETIKGFLLAVRDCARSKGTEAGVPAFVAAEMDRLVAPSVVAQPEPGRASELVEHAAP